MYLEVCGTNAVYFVGYSANTDENDHLRKGAVPNEVFPSVMPEASPKPNSACPGPSLTEEATAVQTPSKVSTKTRQQLDVKAELEKRQGGKQLLNLVVIGKESDMQFTAGIVVGIFITNENAPYQ